MASEIAESLRATVVRMQEQLDPADTALSDLKQLLAGERSEELERKIGAIDERLVQCRAGLGAFTTGKERIPLESKRPDPATPPVELEV